MAAGLHTLLRQALRTALSLHLVVVVTDIGQLGDLLPQLGRNADVIPIELVDQPYKRGSARASVVRVVQVLQRRGHRVPPFSRVSHSVSRGGQRVARLRWLLASSTPVHDTTFRATFRDSE